MFDQRYLPEPLPETGNIQSLGDSSILTNGVFSSPNYVPPAPGSSNTGSGWNIDADGTATFYNIVARGNITALTGTIGGWVIAATTLSSSGNEIIFDSANKVIKVGTGPEITIDGVNKKITIGSLGQIVLDGANKVINIGSSNEIVLDALNKRISVGTANEILIDGNNKRIRSSNYSAGLSGFTIEPDLIEAENLFARGTLRGVTFQYDVISAVGGQLIVANADTLNVDMSALDASTLTIKGNTTFAVNDILLIRAQSSLGIVEEYLRVTNIGSAPTYTVTRDLAAAYASNSNPAWKLGTTVVKVGKSDGASTYSGGWLRLIGEGSNAPFYSVFARTGVAYNAYTEVVRVGNLNGIGGNVTDTFGFFAGNYSAGQYMMYDSANNVLTLIGSFSINSAYTAASAITAGDVCEQGTSASQCQTQTIDDIALTTLFDISALSLWSAQFKMCQISSMTYVGAYQTSANNIAIVTFRYQNGKFIRGPVDTSTITDARSPYDIVGIVRIASDKAMLIYNYNSGGSSLPACRVITINADFSTTITAKTSFTGMNAMQTSYKAIRMEDNKVMFIQSRAGDFDIEAVVITVSGTTPTVGTPISFAASNLGDAILIDTDKVLVVYDNLARILSVSGTTITANTTATVKSDIYGKLTKVSTTKAVYAYADNTNVGANETGQARVLNVSGTTVTVGTEYQFVNNAFENSGESRVRTAYFRNNRGFVLYRLDSPANTNFYATYYTISSSDVLSYDAKIIADYDIGSIYEVNILDSNLDFQTDFDAFWFTQNKYLVGMYFRASKKSIGVSPSTVAAAASLNLINKGLVSGLSGFSVGQEIRDKFDNKVIAVAKTTTSINVV